MQVLDQAPGWVPSRLDRYGGGSTFGSKEQIHKVKQRKAKHANNIQIDTVVDLAQSRVQLDPATDTQFSEFLL